MKDYFGTYHPIVNFLYFMMVILFGMFFLHPVYMIIALSAAFIYSVILGGRKALKFNTVYMLPTLFFIAFINPLFNHQGVTILFYLKSGNPFTLESVIYGIVSAALFVTTIVWFSCYNKVMDADKFMYLFGRLIPSSSLVFSMALRFVPLYKARIKVIADAQKCIGKDIAKGSIINRAKNGMQIIAIMTTWALESSIETADSMKARGYGLKGRTAFSNYKRRQKDTIALGILIGCSLWLMMSWGLGIIEVSYFPRISFTRLSRSSLLAYSCYFILCYLPIIINGYDWLLRRKRQK